MNAKQLPALNPQNITPAKTALHAWSGILGSWLKSVRPKRKHWWHASLRPSLHGLTTGVVHAGIDFELELNLRASQLQCRTSAGDHIVEPLRGQSPAQLASVIQDFLVSAGIDEKLIPQTTCSETNFDQYSVAQARQMGVALNSVATVMCEFQAGIREETSPIQLWPHHFDLSMIWLPGSKIPGQDPDNEEYSDQQMNFGFTFGDEGIPEPYFYVTAYPLPDAPPRVPLPPGTQWHSDGFNGAVLLYRTMTQTDDPNAYLLTLWKTLLATGREHMTGSTEQGDSK